jgi:adenylosuccinate lyase
MDRFDCISPLDFRYHDPEVAQYLSEEAFTRYKCRVEVALTTVLRNGDPKEIQAVADAASQVTTEQVYTEEARIKHDIRALVNCIRKGVPEHLKPFIHLGATSYDIIDTANALRFRDATKKVIVPRLRKLAQVLIELAEREAETPQIGRTHGQHAVPITFGFAMAGFVSRLGMSTHRLRKHADGLRGKLSGAVGAYNATSLLVADPVGFERLVLNQLDLWAEDHATQIVQPEPLARLLLETVLAAGVMANLADDLRHLQRTEIGEVGEAFESDQVGSSTMPQKRNPIAFENVKSLWKAVVARANTVLLDQISEHQRDLTNSASGRTHAEILAYTAEMARRLTAAVSKLRVDRDAMADNLARTGAAVLAEPLYIVLAYLGHPDAHETVRRLSLTSQLQGHSLILLASLDPDIAPYWDRMNAQQRAVLTGKSPYLGLAAERTRAITTRWRKELGIS